MIETKVALSYDGVLELGYLAENDARCFVFNISEWQDCFEAGGSVTLLARRPWDDDCYPCVIETDGAEVRWTIKCSDVAVPGTGRIVLQYKVGDTVVRSKPFSTHISLGIGGDLSKVPPAQQPWVQEVLNAKDSAEKAADEAKEAAESVKSTHASTHSEDGSDPITPESIGAMPGYKGFIYSGEDLNDYTSPGNYVIRSDNNAGVVNAPFVGDVGTFLQVIPFTWDDDSQRVVQEAFTNKIGGVDRKWRTKSISDEQWSPWTDSCEVYIATYDESINVSYDKVKEAWNVLTWKFGKYDDGRLAGNKTVFCKYREKDTNTNEYEYYMIPLSKITPNYISFRGMTSDTTMRVVYLRNPDSFVYTKWGWRGWKDDKQVMVTTETLNTKLSALEARITALEEVM